MIEPTALVTDLLDAHNRRDNRRLAAHYASGATVHQSDAPGPVSAGEWIEIRDGMVESFPDLTFTAGRVATAGDAMMFEIRITGTNEGPLHLNDTDRRMLESDAMSLPPTGLSMQIDGVVVVEVADGLITAERHFLNLAASHEQLMLVAPAETGSTETRS